jgi:hypothetical protein
MVAFGFCKALNGLNRLLFGRLGRFLGRFSVVFIVGGMRSMSDVVWACEGVCAVFKGSSVERRMNGVFMGF